VFRKHCFRAAITIRIFIIQVLKILTNQVRGVYHQQDHLLHQMNQTHHHQITSTIVTYYMGDYIQIIVFTYSNIVTKQSVLARFNEQLEDVGLYNNALYTTLSSVNAPRMNWGSLA